MIPRVTDPYSNQLFQQYNDPAKNPTKDAGSTQAGSTDSECKNYDYDNHDNGHISATEGEDGVTNIDPPKNEIEDSTENKYSQYKDYAQKLSWVHFS